MMHARQGFSLKHDPVAGSAPWLAPAVRGAIGIPQALFAYMYPGLWTTFFEALGYAVVASGPTTRQRIERAGLVSETEHCLPVKLLDAHLDALTGRVKRVFVPRILSTRRGFIACPKLGALPDAVRARFGDRFDVLTVDVDENKEPVRKTLGRLARRLGATAREGRRAADAAETAMRRTRFDGAVTPAESGKPYVLLGHPYNVLDPYLSGPVLHILERLGVPGVRMAFDSAPQPGGPLQWDSCALIYDALQALDPARYAGAIHLSSFSCGCDSIAEPFFRDAAQARGLPSMVLCLDEHASLTGLETRIEAFVDTVSGAAL